MKVLVITGDIQESFQNNKTPEEYIEISNTKAVQIYTWHFPVRKQYKWKQLILEQRYLVSVKTAWSEARLLGEITS